MHQLLNTLYLTTEGAYLRLDHDTLRVEVERETKLQVPIHHLGGIVCFGDVLVSPAALARCAKDGRFVVFLDRNGGFQARVEGPISGNVLLRCAQHAAMGNAAKTLTIARHVVGGKIQNSRQIVLRAARETDDQATAIRCGIRQSRWQTYWVVCRSRRTWIFLEAWRARPRENTSPRSTVWFVKTAQRLR